MTNLEHIRSLPPEELCKYLIDAVYDEMMGYLYRSPSDDEFIIYDNAKDDCLRWLGAEHIDIES